MTEYKTTERQREQSRAWRQANPERYAQLQKAWRLANPGYRRKTKDRNGYKRNQEYRAKNRGRYNVMSIAARRGISEAEYRTILAAQNGVCACCGSPPKPGRALHLDHNHITNKVRQFLCSRCNTSLATLEDPLLPVWSAYLEAHNRV